MNSARLARGTSQAAVFVRLAAFLVAAVSVAVIPSALLAAAVGHVSAQAAFAAAGVAVLVTVLAALVARSLDPLRG